MSPFAVRLGAVGGWLAIVGLSVGLIILPAAIAGPPPSPSASPEALRAYFDHPGLAILNGYVTGFVALGFVAFGLGMRVAFGAGSERDRAFADLGVVLVVIAMGLNLISGALVAALVDAAGRGGTDLTSLVRLHDVTYDGLGDVLEGGWMAAFSVAMLGGVTPRWIGWYGIALGVAHWVKALGPFTTLPDMVDMLFGLLILVWFLATVVTLTRIARGRVGSRSRAPLPA